jgi:hypothetical protein
MINLEFEINGQVFSLNEKENIDKLTTSHLKKLGFFSRRLLKPKKDEKIYFSKNCYITLFKSLKNQNGKSKYEFEGELLDDFMFGPSGNNQDYLSGPWGTSIYLHFSDNKLRKVSFQTIGNRIMSKKVIIEFEKRIVSIYGKPESKNNNGIRICTWTDEDSKAISELHERLQNSYIHWMTV